jgi:putative ABC transport system permease protein
MTPGRDIGYKRSREKKVRFARFARVRLVLASASLLPTLGVRPIRGRAIGPGEDFVGGPKVVLICFEEWKQRLGGNEGLLGKTIELDDVPWSWWRA